MYLKIILTSVVSLIVLFLLAKLIGNKQISEISLFDYINSITIGSIAAEMAIAQDDDFISPLIAMTVYGLAAFLISYINMKSQKARRILTGRSIVLMDNGEIYKKNLRRAKLDISEFLTMLRIQGYFNIADVHCAYLEPNGKISILPKDNFRPVTPKDMKLDVEKTNVSVSLITDGKYLDKNIDELHLAKSWIESQIRVKGAKDVKDVFYASIDSNNVLTVFMNTKKSPRNDDFQ